MKKGKSLVSIVIIFAIIVLLGYYAFTILKSSGVGEDRNFKLGLDLAGGVSITYQAVGDDYTEDDMNDTVYKLQKRVESYSTEAQVYKSGNDNNRIVVEIPGVTDANEILEELGKPGSLEFQDKDGNVILTGTDVVDAQPGTNDQTTAKSKYVVNLTFSDDAAETFYDFTKDNVGQTLAIVYDGETISAPNVTEAISGGKCEISGMESYEAAEQLASSIRIGSLSVELEELQSQVVSAQLGSDAIRTSIMAAVIGVLIVMVIMIVLYAVPGVIAAISLALYSGLVVATIYVFDVTLTLPGLAGVILSIGMAVDANVIIFARIREELAEGRQVQTAIKIGYKKALSAILDGNITTLIAAAVLGLRGSGSVRGFAATLAIGIILSMFTALVISRILMYAFHGLGVRDPKFYRPAKPKKVIPFVNRRIIYFVISLAVIVVGFGSMGVHSAKGEGALNYSLEFAGGTSTTFDVGEDMTVEQIEAEVVPVFSEVTHDSDIQTQKVQNSTQIVVKTRTLTLNEREELATALEENYGVESDKIQTETISSTISSEMRADALWAVIIATICMLIYIWFRFKDIRFASSAVIALVHDILIVLTCYALMRISVGGTFIACMLTILGYSINDTIVVFDRIRENLNNLHVKDKVTVREVANKSISQTLGRSLNTSITTFVVVLVLYILGVASIKDFALPLMVGVISGTYSSIFIAASLWFGMKLRLGKKKLPDHIERKSDGNEGAAILTNELSKKKKKKLEAKKAKEENASTQV